MNRLLSLIERIAIGPEMSELDLPLLGFREGQRLTRRSLMEAVLILASVGKGKTTLARTVYRAMLRDGFGGLVLSVKGSQVPEFQDLCRREGRERDCLVLSPGGVHRFNPLQGETNPNEAAAYIGELAEVLANKVREGGENEAFWRTQLEVILKNLFALCMLAHGRPDVLLAAELFDSRALSPGQVSDPSWQQSSAMATVLREAKNHDHDPNIRLAVEYFEKTYPTHGDRLQGSLAAVVTSVFDYLRRPPLRDLFAGESTFCMDDLLNGGRICLVGLPTLDGDDGRIANAIMQFSFCRAATRLQRTNFAFLASDECQETASRELMRKLAVLREFKVATVLLTQNLAVLDERLGESTREALCGLLGTKIFGPQGHAGTRQWASEQIGKRKVEVESKTTGRTYGERSGRSKSTSTHDQWDYRVPPLRFAELKVGETIVLRDAEVWHARWHRESPGRRGTVRIVG